MMRTTGPIGSGSDVHAGGTFMPDGRLLHLHKAGDNSQLFARDLQTGHEEMVFDYQPSRCESPDRKC